MITGGGTVDVEAGGTAFGATALSGVLAVLGTESGATVGSGATEFVLSGGLASGAVVSGGDEIVEIGGAATGTTLVGGTQEVLGLASGTMLGTGGFQFVAGGGTAIGTAAGSGGDEYVASAGTLSAATISGGTIELASGAGLGGGAISFAVSGGGLLRLDDLQHFSGTVAGFGRQFHIAGDGVSGTLLTDPTVSTSANDLSEIAASRIG